MYIQKTLGKYCKEHTGIYRYNLPEKSITHYIIEVWLEERAQDRKKDVIKEQLSTKWKSNE